MIDVQQQIKNIKAQIGARPIRTATRSFVQPPNLYLVVGGNLLNGGNSIQFSSGIARRTDLVTAAEFPAGSGGSPGDTVVVPAWPMPTGLPMGVGVGISPWDGSYVYLLNDSRANWPGDLPLGRRVYVSTTITFDLPGSVTYRYPCKLVVAGL